MQQQRLHSDLCVALHMAQLYHSSGSFQPASRGAAMHAEFQLASPHVCCLGLALLLQLPCPPSEAVGPGVPVLGEGILDDGAHLSVLLAELGGHFGVVGVLQHAQQVVVHQHLRGRR